MHDLATYRDEELITLLKENNKEAFAELYNRYHKAVYGYLVAQIKSHHYTQDILHEVFLKIWEIRMKLQLKSNFSAYLFRICHNKAVDFMRTIASDRQFRKEFLSNYAQSSDYVSITLEELQQMDSLVEEALEQLTPQRRIVFDLCRKQHKSYQQVAEELGISPNTVKEHMTKALATLRGFLQHRVNLTIVFCLTVKIL
ncbi:MAG: RNA polymerase sigma-70 factor [Chitinophagaceae bacterium]|nr:RNA polymerase sigma-70 factor [Chitinophagaceae bacterium]